MAAPHGGDHLRFHALFAQRTPLSSFQVTDLVQNAGLLMRAAQAGAIETWRIVFEELRGRGLLEEVRHVARPRASRFCTAPPDPR